MTVSHLADMQGDVAGCEAPLAAGLSSWKKVGLYFFTLKEPALQVDCQD